jgi:hypothetical protein
MRSNKIIKSKNRRPKLLFVKKSTTKTKIRATTSYLQNNKPKEKRNLQPKFLGIKTMRKKFRK